jgi:hypothetical protein
MPEAVKPVLQAILLADHIYEDRTTGKKIIAGTFNRLFFKRQVIRSEVGSGGEKRLHIPGGMQAGSPYAYVSLTEVRGAIHCVLRYVDLEDDRSLLRCEFEVQNDDPLKSVEIIVPMPPLPTGKAGIHALELLCDGEPIGALRIQVEELKDDSST